MCRPAGRRPDGGNRPDLLHTQTGPTWSEDVHFQTLQTLHEPAGIEKIF